MHFTSDSLDRSPNMSLSLTVIHEFVFIEYGTFMSSKSKEENWLKFFSILKQKENCSKPNKYQNAHNSR